MLKHPKPRVPYRFTASRNNIKKTGLVFLEEGKLKIIRCSYAEVLDTETSSTWKQLIEEYFSEKAKELVLGDFSYTFTLVSIEELLTDENLHIRSWAKKRIVE